MKVEAIHEASYSLPIMQSCKQWTLKVGSTSNFKLELPCNVYKIYHNNYKSVNSAEIESTVSKKRQEKI